MLHINHTPDPKPRIHLGHARRLAAAFRRAYFPGACARTVLACLVATASVLQGLDLRPEADALAPLLLERPQPPAMRIA